MSTRHKGTLNAGKALALAGLFAVPFAATAQTAPASDPAPTAAELDQRIKVLERKLEIAKDDAAAAAAAAPTVKASPSGFSLASNNGATVIKFKAVFDADNRYFFNDLQPSGGTALLARGADQTLMRLARPYVEGTLGGLVDFRIMPDFAGGKVVLQDAFGAVKFKPYFVLTAGKFKSPVGLERLQSDTDLRFIERALPDRLIPNRDIGVQLSGDVLPGVLTYQVAYLNGVIDGGSTDNTSNVPAAANDGDTNNSKDIAVRLFANPFANSQAFVLRGLGVGVGASRGQLHGYIDTTGTYSLLTSYKTTGQQTFFSYRAATATTGATFADGLRQRISPQAYYYYGPFGLLTEYVVSKTEVRRQNNANTAILRGTLANTAWQVQGGVFLTGEDEGYKFPAPKHPYQAGKPGWGAVELVARYSVLDIDDAAFVGGANSFADPTKAASKAKAWAVGVNWELTANFKLIANYEDTSFNGGATVAAGGDSPTEKLLVTRFQFAY